jgi:hypothetical protein
LRLLKFGDTIINIDRAIRIDDNGRFIDIDFVPVDTLTTSLNIQLEGPAAEALRGWLATNAEDLLGGVEPLSDQLGDPRPYVSPRSTRNS